MELTGPQRRTLEQLIGTERRPSFPGELAQGLRDRIEEAVRGLELAEPLWLSKERLNDHVRCEGKFQAGVAGEAPPFEHSARSAAGVLMHKAIEVEVGSRDPLDPHAVADVALGRVLEREERFQEYWGALTGPERDEVLMDVARRVTLFDATFPPLKELRSNLAPVAELRVRSELLGGDVVLSGQIDLVLGVPDRVEPSRATRLVIDLKTGGAYPEFAEDLRFYALMMTLRFGVPPYRTASVFLESGSWQAEDVTPEVLEHAADRVVAAARSAAALANGRRPVLRAGPYCGWCPRAPTCPAAELAAAPAS
jgi:PD-(D/E)XK nuclease superfamily